jgi:molybdopterin-biosynthesis enzyme MoeA-like protein
MRTASILIVGDEILSGEIRDENGPYLIQRLAAAGVRVQRVVACPDREDEIDVSRPAMARALGVPLVTHVEAEGRIRGFYGPLTTAAELEMARLPQGARLVHGPRTGTFGFAVSGLYGFPGVPFLLKDLTDAIVPEFRGAPLSRAEIFTNLREGEIADCLTETQRGSPEVAIGSYPVFTDGRWIVRVVVRGEDAGRVDACEQGLRAQLEGLSRSSRRA